MTRWRRRCWGSCTHDIMPRTLRAQNGKARAPDAGRHPEPGEAPQDNGRPERPHAGEDRMTASVCTTCGREYVREKKNQVSCSRACARQGPKRLCDLAPHCSGICRRYAVKRRMRHDYIRSLHDIVGLELPRTVPNSVRVMHAIDPTYWNCRKCGINVHYDGTRCPVLQTSPTPEPIQRNQGIPACRQACARHTAGQGGRHRDTADPQDTNYDAGPSGAGRKAVSPPLGEADRPHDPKPESGRRAHGAPGKMLTRSPSTGSPSFRDAR